MHPIAQISKPRRHSLGVYLLNPRVFGRSCDRFAGDGNPGLVPAVEVQVRDAVVLEIGEFLAVRVGEEKEVRAGAFGYCHGAADGLWEVLVDCAAAGEVWTYANAIAEGAHHDYFEVVGDLLEVLEFLLCWGVVVPLLRDGWVLALVDFALL